jgi:hypothetical protein
VIRDLDFCRVCEDVASAEGVRSNSVGVDTVCADSVELPRCTGIDESVLDEELVELRELVEEEDSEVVEEPEVMEDSEVIEDEGADVTESDWDTDSDPVEETDSEEAEEDSDVGGRDRSDGKEMEVGRGSDADPMGSVVKISVGTGAVGGTGRADDGMLTAVRESFGGGMLTVLPETGSTTYVLGAPRKVCVS